MSGLRCDWNEKLRNKMDYPLYTGRKKPKVDRRFKDRWLNLKRIQQTNFDEFEFIKCNVCSSWFWWARWLVYKKYWIKFYIHDSWIMDMHSRWLTLDRIGWLVMEISKKKEEIICYSNDSSWKVHTIWLKDRIFVHQKGKGLSQLVLR